MVGDGHERAVGTAGRTGGPDWELISGSDIETQLTRRIMELSPVVSATALRYCLFYDIAGSLMADHKVVTGLGRCSFHKPSMGISVDVCIGMEVMQWPPDRIRELLARLALEGAAKLHAYASRKLPDMDHQVLLDVIGAAVKDFIQMPDPEPSHSTWTTRTFLEYKARRETT